MSHFKAKMHHFLFPASVRSFVSEMEFYTKCAVLLLRRAGSPWRVDVMNPAQVSVCGADSQLLPINVPTWFEIQGAVACVDGDLVVNIMCTLYLLIAWLLIC